MAEILFPDDTTKSNLIIAYWRLYCKNKATIFKISDVTREAGYHRTTFYNHFASLEQLHQTIINNVLNPYDGSKWDSSPEEMVDVSIDKFVSIAEYAKILLGPERDPILYQAHFQILKPLFKRYFAKYPKVQDLQTELLFEFLYNGCNAFMVRWHYDFFRK